MHRMNSLNDGVQHTVDIISTIDSIVLQANLPTWWRLVLLLKRLVLENKGVVLPLSLQNCATRLSAVRMLLDR